MQISSKLSQEVDKLISSKFNHIEKELQKNKNDQESIG